MSVGRDSVRLSAPVEQLIERSRLMGRQAGDDSGQGEAPRPRGRPARAAGRVRARRGVGRRRPVGGARGRAGGRRRAGGPLRRGGAGGDGRDHPAVGRAGVLGRRRDARLGAGDDARGQRGPAAAAPPPGPARRVGRLPQLRDRRRPGDGPGLGRQPRPPGLDPGHAGCPASAGCWPTAPSPRRRPSSSRRRSSR